MLYSSSDEVEHRGTRRVIALVPQVSHVVLVVQDEGKSQLVEVNNIGKCIRQEFHLRFFVTVNQVMMDKENFPIDVVSSRMLVHVSRKFTMD